MWWVYKHWWREDLLYSSLSPYLLLINALSLCSGIATTGGGFACNKVSLFLFDGTFWVVGSVDWCWFCLSWCDQTDFVVISSEKGGILMRRRHLKGVILFHFCVLVRVLLMSFLLKGFSACIRRGGSLVSAKSLVFLLSPPLLLSPPPRLWFGSLLFWRKIVVGCI